MNYFLSAALLLQIASHAQADTITFQEGNDWRRIAAGDSAKIDCSGGAADAKCCVKGGFETETNESGTMTIGGTGDCEGTTLTNAMLENCTTEGGCNIDCDAGCTLESESEGGDSNDMTGLTITTTPATVATTADDTTADEQKDEDEEPTDEPTEVEDKDEQQDNAAGADNSGATIASVGSPLLALGLGIIGLF